MHKINSPDKLEKRFILLKKFVKKNNLKFGPFWENAKKTFNINFIDGYYYSLGKRNYLPFVYNHHKYDKKKLVKISDDYFIKIGNKNLCITSNAGNTALVYSLNYYNLLEKYFNKNIITCEVGAGSGLLQFILHHFKKSKSIIIDIPEVLLNSVALCFTLFPNAKVLLPNEILTDKLDVDKYDFIFLIPSQKHLIKKNSIDFCFNTQSFMEMKQSEINEYIQLFDKILKRGGFCFISNRVLKSSYFFSYNFTNTYFKKIFLKIDEYHSVKKNISLLNLLLVKNNLKGFYFNFYNYFSGFFYLKKNEIFYWLKFYLKRFLIIIFQYIKYK